MIVHILDSNHSAQSFWRITALSPSGGCTWRMGDLCKTTSPAGLHTASVSGHLWRRIIFLYQNWMSTGRRSKAEGSARNTIGNWLARKAGTSITSTKLNRATDWPVCGISVYFVLWHESTLQKSDARLLNRSASEGWSCIFSPCWCWKK